MNNEHKGWIGVDLDGTLAEYTEWKGIHHIGNPIPAMVNRVKNWIAEGHEVRIFTARVSYHSCVINGITVQEATNPIVHWCVVNIGRILRVTNEKDLAMIELWDDRAVQVIPNTGCRVDGKE